MNHDSTLDSSAEASQFSRKPFDHVQNWRTMSRMSILRPFSFCWQLSQPACALNIHFCFQRQRHSSLAGAHQRGSVFGHDVRHVQARASAPPTVSPTIQRMAEHLEALAFVATIKNDSALQQQAIDQCCRICVATIPQTCIHPSRFHGLAKPTRAFALAWTGSRRT